jgi:hypothetical protein
MRRLAEAERVAGVVRHLEQPDPSGPRVELPDRRRLVVVRRERRAGADQHLAARTLRARDGRQGEQQEQNKRRPHGPLHHRGAASANAGIEWRLDDVRVPFASSTSDTPSARAMCVTVLHVGLASPRSIRAYAETVSPAA